MRTIIIIIMMKEPSIDHKNEHDEENEGSNDAA